MLFTIIIVFLLVAILASWILLVLICYHKKESQVSESDKDLHNLNVRYSFGEFSPNEYLSRLETIKDLRASQDKTSGDCF